MTAEFNTNSPTQMGSTDAQVVDQAIAELEAKSPMMSAEERMEAQRRLAWERDRARIQDFLNDPTQYLSAFWQQYKPVIINLLVIGLAIFALRVVLSIIGFITGLPLLSPLFELVGFGYTIWFTYRYLLKAETRRELGSKINEIKQTMIGTAKDLKQDATAVAQGIQQTTQAIKQTATSTVEQVKQDTLSATETVVGDSRIDVKKAITIQKSPEELYQFWRNFENLPRFMNHLESVKVMDDQRSHWVMKAPLGSTVEWDAEIIDEKPNQSIVWKSLAGAEVDSTGSVVFTSANGSGTEVKVTMQYNPPAGIVGAAAAALFGENPEQQLDEDLSRFKQVMEATA